MLLWPDLCVCAKILRELNKSDKFQKEEFARLPNSSPVSHISCQLCLDVPACDRDRGLGEELDAAGRASWGASEGALSTRRNITPDSLDARSGRRRRTIEWRRRTGRTDGRTGGINCMGGNEREGSRVRRRRPFCNQTFFLTKITRN